MKKLLATIAIFALLFFAGSKVLVWFQVTSALNGLKQDLSASAIIDWGWISSSYDGTIAVDNLEITPFFLKDTLFFERVVVDLGSPLDLFISSMKGKGLVMPSFYSLSFEGGSLPLTNNTFSSFRSDDERYRNMGLFSLHGCGDIQQLTGRELLAMGFDSVKTSFDLNYSAEDGMVSIKGELREMLDFDIIAKLLPGSVDLSKGVMLGLTPLFKNLQIEVQDGGYYRRLSFLCGRLNGLSQSEYVQAALEEWGAKLGAKGIVVNRLVHDVFKAYADDGKALTLTLAPTSGAMKLFTSLLDDDVPPLSAQTIISSYPSLGVHLSSDSGDAMPVELLFDESLLSLFVMDAIQLREYHEALAIQEAIRNRPVLVEKSFKAVSFDEAESLKGQKIQVEVLSGKKYLGILTQIGESGIEVTEYLEGGSFAYSITNEEVFQIRAWR